MLHQVGVSFDLYYDARKHKIKMHCDLIRTFDLVFHIVLIHKISVYFGFLLFMESDFLVSLPSDNVFLKFLDFFHLLLN